VTRHARRGCIASAGFGGHRITVGHWDDGPLGPMADVMWATPDGRRVLLADGEPTAAFVSAVYAFDEVRVVPFTVTRDARSLDLVAGPLALSLRAGRGWPLPPLALRPPAVTRLVERPVARALMGVEAYGTSPSGVREWYRATRYRPVIAGAAALDGVDLGPLGPVDPPLGVGFSEPPRQPSMVLVRPLLEDPTGRLDAVLAEGRRTLVGR
jgi:hypothetical protein